MSVQVTVNNITGSTPFQVYICDDPINTCAYVNTISSFPYVFQIPQILEGQASYNLKIIDNNGCIIIENLP